METNRNLRAVGASLLSLMAFAAGSGEVQAQFGSGVSVFGNDVSVSNPALPFPAFADGPNAVAVGNTSAALGPLTTAVGRRAVANGNASSAFGGNAGFGSPFTGGTTAVGAGSGSILAPGGVNGVGGTCQRPVCEWRMRNAILQLSE